MNEPGKPERTAKAIHRWEVATFAAALIIAVAVWICAPLATAQQPVLNISGLGSNQFLIQIQAVTTTNYTLFWTPLLNNEIYPWQVLLTNNVGETNFTLDCADWPIGFFKVMVGGDGDGDGVPAWRDADDRDASIGGVAVTIDSPLNGSVIQ